MEDLRQNKVENSWLDVLYSYFTYNMQDLLQLVLLSTLNDEILDDVMRRLGIDETHGSLGSQDVEGIENASDASNWLNDLFLTVAPKQFLELAFFSMLSDKPELRHVRAIKVIRVTGDQVRLVDQLGSGYSMSKQELLALDSATVYSGTTQVTRTELADILASSHGQVFTVCYRKQVDKNLVKEKLKRASLESESDDKKLNELAINLLEGEERVLTGYLLESTNFGRSLVVDVELQGNR